MSGTELCFLGFRNKILITAVIIVALGNHAGFLNHVN